MSGIRYEENKNCNSYLNWKDSKVMNFQYLAAVLELKTGWSAEVEDRMEKDRTLSGTVKALVDLGVNVAWHLHKGRMNVRFYKLGLHPFTISKGISYPIP